MGATVPKSTVATAREAAKLKGKLIGRKRVRDEEGSVSTIGKTTIADDSEEEEESRTTAISRKPEEIRPLFVTGKGKEKYVSTKGDGQKSKVNMGEGETRLNPFIVPKTPPSNFHSLNREVSPSLSLDGPSPSKKRRKKKEKNQDTKRNIEEEDEWTGFGDSFKDLVETAIVSAEGPEESTAHSPSINMPSGNTTISSLSEVSVSAAKFSNDVSPASSVLNLNGPPAPNSLEMPGSKKRRRHRRKKNKNEQGTGSVEGTTFLSL